MNCGQFSNHCCPCMSILTALEGGDRAYLIETVPMRSSLSCEPDGSRQALDQTELCAHATAHDRFQEWVEAGVFLKRGLAGVEQFDELCGIEWDWLSMDGAMTKAPLGGEKNRAQSH
jgi:hypothetical protein